MDRGDGARSATTYWLFDTGLGYENGDLYADFLPPALVTDEDGHAEFMRAVVIITEETEREPRDIRKSIRPPS